MSRSVSSSIGISIAVVLTLTLGTVFTALFLLNRQSSFARAQQDVADLNEVLTASVTFAMGLASHDSTSCTRMVFS